MKTYLCRTVGRFSNLPSIHWGAVGAFFCLWLALFALRSSWTVEDTLLHSTLIPNAFQGHGVDLSSIPFGFDLNRPGDLSFVKDKYGRTLAVHPIGMITLSLPTQAILWLAAWMNGMPLDVTDPSFLPTRLIIEKLAASFLAALSVCYFYLTLTIFVPSRTSFAISVLYAFGSSSLSMLSQGLWPHTGINLLLMYLAHFLLRQNVPITRGREYIFWGALGMLYGIRPTAIPFVGIFGFAFCRLVGRPRASSFIVSFLALLPTIVWNIALFQHILGGYIHTAHRNVGAQPSQCLSRLGLILFSPLRGFITFNPFVVFALCAYKPLRTAPPKKQAVLMALLACIGCHYLLCSTNPEWNGGYTFGPRYMLDVLAPSFLLAGIGFHSIRARFPVIMNVIFALIAALSFTIHLFGVVGNRIPSIQLNEAYQRLLVPPAIFSQVK